MSVVDRSVILGAGHASVFIRHDRGMYVDASQYGLSLTHGLFPCLMNAGARRQVASS
ncbi:MAG: hypothetical protein ACFNX6_07290 [Lautropia mirabilis]